MRVHRFRTQAARVVPIALKAMIARLQAENARMSATLQAHEHLVQALRLRIAKLQKQAFGKSSEKVEREIARLDLALEDLLIAAAEQRSEPTDQEDVEPPAADTVMGADVPDSTLLDWCGRAVKVLAPIIERIEAAVMTAPVLHADDTPIRVLDRSRRDRGCGKGVKQGRVWANVSDQRRRSGTAPPGVVYRFSPDRKGEHPWQHLQDSGGILRADAYAGFNRFYGTRAGGSSQFREAACRAHPRHDIHDVWQATQSEIAREALDRIGKLYDVERQISGQRADLRKAVRQEHSRPQVEAFKTWTEAQLARIPGKGD
jgi:hypothetical protein